MKEDSLYDINLLSLEQTKGYNLLSFSADLEP